MSKKTAFLLSPVTQTYKNLQENWISLGMGVIDEWFLNWKKWHWNTFTLHSCSMNCHCWNCCKNFLPSISAMQSMLHDGKLGRDGNKDQNCWVIMPPVSFWVVSDSSVHKEWSKIIKKQCFPYTVSKALVSWVFSLFIQAQLCHGGTFHTCVLKRNQKKGVLSVSLKNLLFQDGCPHVHIWADMRRW